MAMPAANQPMVEGSHSCAVTSHPAPEDQKYNVHTMPSTTRPTPTSVDDHSSPSRPRARRTINTAKAGSTR